MLGTASRTASMLRGRRRAQRALQDASARAGWAARACARSTAPFAPALDAQTAARSLHIAAHRAQARTSAAHDTAQAVRTNIEALVRFADTPRARARAHALLTPANAIALAHEAEAHAWRSASAKASAALASLDALVASSTYSEPLCYFTDSSGSSNRPCINGESTSRRKPSGLYRKALSAVSEAASAARDLHKAAEDIVRALDDAVMPHALGVASRELRAAAGKLREIRTTDFNVWRRALVSRTPLVNLRGGEAGVRNMASVHARAACAGALAAHEAAAKRFSLTAEVLDATKGMVDAVRGTERWGGSSRLMVIFRDLRAEAREMFENADSNLADWDNALSSVSEAADAVEYASNVQNTEDQEIDAGLRRGDRENRFQQADCNTEGSPQVVRPVRFQQPDCHFNGSSRNNRQVRFRQAVIEHRSGRDQRDVQFQHPVSDTGESSRGVRNIRFSYDCVDSTRPEIRSRHPISDDGRSVNSENVTRSGSYRALRENRDEQNIWHARCLPAERRGARGYGWREVRFANGREYSWENRRHSSAADVVTAENTFNDQDERQGSSDNHRNEVPTAASGIEGNRGAESTTICVIDQEEVKEGELVVRLPCFHVFHAGCVLPYLRSQQSPQCPLDRISVERSEIPRLPTWRWTANPPPV